MATRSQSASATASATKAPRNWRRRPRKRQMRAIHRQAIRLFMGGASPPEVGAALGVSRWTAWKWLTGHKVRGIKEALDRVRDDRIARAEWAADPTIRAAIATMEATIRDPRVPHEVRVNTSIRVIDALTFRELPAPMGHNGPRVGGITYR